MPTDAHESSAQPGTPGVYVRSQQHNDLDFLWDASGNKPSSKAAEEKRPILFFILGALTGIIATSIVFLLVMNKPTALDTSNVDVPIIEEVKLVPKVTDPTQPEAIEQTESEAQGTEAREGSSGKGKPSRGGKVAVKYHTVTYGDTLEKISIRYYGTSTPTLIEKIARANKMRNPNALSINQKLVIPPKNY